jgi:putative NADH-flavin reductase
MKLLVLGATGGTGLEIISQAIERGHSLTALFRAPDPLKRFGDRIAVAEYRPYGNATKNFASVTAIV